MLQNVYIFLPYIMVARKLAQTEMKKLRHYHPMYNTSQ